MVITRAKSDVTPLSPIAGLLEHGNDRRKAPRVAAHCH